MYQKILVALDLGDCSEQVLARSVAITKNFNGELFVVHVAAPKAAGFVSELPVHHEADNEHYQSLVKEKLNKLCESYAIPVKNQVVLVGRPDAEINSFANMIEANLIIVAPREKSGLQLLSSSTSKGLLKLADTDYLAIKLNTQDDD